MSDLSSDERPHSPVAHDAQPDGDVLLRLCEAERQLEALKEKRADIGGLIKGAALVAGGLPIANSTFGVIGATILGPIGLLVAGSAAVASAGFLRSQVLEGKIRKSSGRLESIKSSIDNGAITKAEAIAALDELLATLSSS